MALFVIALTVAVIPLGVQPAYAYCGDSDTAYQDCIMEDARRALGTAPTQPNTPGDVAKVAEFYKLQEQKDAAALELAAKSLPGFNQELAHYQKVLASGGRPDVFFGQSPLPSLGGNNFLDPFYAGPGMPNFNADAAFTPNFVNDLNSFQNNPSDGGTGIDFSPLLPPDSCASPNFFLPTKITFFNLSSRPLLLSLIDTRCQEVPYILLPPQSSYASITFVGQLWSFRNGLTGEFVQGMRYYVITDTSEHISITFDTPTGLQVHDENPAEARIAALPDVPSISSDGITMARRMAAMYERQADQVYSDPALQALQVEASNYFLDQIYADPLALYLLQERETLGEQARAASPDYARAKALAAEIAAWTDVPSDSATLRARYAKRMGLQLLIEHVDADEAAYLLKNPAIAQKLSDLSERLQQRADDLRHTPESLVWQANWQQRWDRAYYASERGYAEIQELLDIQLRNKDFAEYQRLNNELGQLIPSLSDLAPVKHIVELQRAADSNLAVQAQLRDLTDTFYAASIAALDGADATAILERFYERVNALGLATPAYRRLRGSGEAAMGKLDAFRAEVHAAVSACYDQHGDECDLGSDGDVQALLQSGRATPLVRAVTAYYRDHDAFWHGFYKGQPYLNLENQAKVDLKAPLGAAEAGLETARKAYEQGQARIPALDAVQLAQAQLYNDLCSSVRASALPVSDPAAQVCPRLNRMAFLAGRLVPDTAGVRNTNKAYIPLVLR
jgi:hypothetical protein